jgi:hypothetical protein
MRFYIWFHNTEMPPKHLSIHQLSSADTQAE